MLYWCDQTPCGHKMMYESLSGGFESIVGGGLHMLEVDEVDR